MFATALSGGDAPHHLSAVFNHLGGVEGTFRAGETLYDYFRLFVYKY
jgi:hypothetical protein